MSPLPLYASIPRSQHDQSITPSSPLKTSTPETDATTAKTSEVAETSFQRAPDDRKRKLSESDPSLPESGGSYPRAKYRKTRNETPFLLTQEIERLLKEQKPEEAYFILEKMIKHGPTPNKFTFGILINDCAQRKNPEKAQLLLKRMQDCGIKPNEVIYNSLMNAYAKAGDLKKAEKVLSQMQESGVNPNDITYKTLMNAYAKAGDLKKAEKVLSQMQIDGIEASAATYSSMIKGYVKVGDLETAFFYFDLACLKLKEINEKPLIKFSIINPFFEFYIEKGEFESAKQLFKKHFEIQQKDSSLDCRRISPTQSFIQLLLFLENNPRLRKIQIITGKGLHSSKVPCAIKDYLIEKIHSILPYWKIGIDEQNEGRINLTYQPPASSGYLL